MRRAVARVLGNVKAHVPDRALGPLLSARSLLGDGPAVGLPPYRRVLVLAPHPDDETIACGGTIALLAASGASVTVLVASDGEASRGGRTAPEETARRRRGETRAAAGTLGVSDVRFLGLPDGGLHGARPRLAAAVDVALTDTSPELLLLPSFLDDHPDHLALNRALHDAAPSGDLPVWGGEVWTPVPATRLVDITGVLERKRAALAAHVTAARTFDLEAMLGLNRYRSVHGLLGRGHAEAFLAAPADRYLAAAWRGADRTS